MEGRSGERTAQHEGRLPKLGGQVLGDALVGGGRGGEHGRAGVQFAQDVGDAAVVGPEVVAPVGDCVGFVDDEETEAPGEAAHDALAEGRVREAFG